MVQPTRMALYLGRDPYRNHQTMQRKFARRRWRRYYQRLVAAAARGEVEVAFRKDRRREWPAGWKPPANPTDLLGYYRKLP